MRALALIILGLLLGAAGGVGSAWWVLNESAAFGNVAAGPWRGPALAGSNAANPYERAVVARRGLLAMPASEALYYTLDQDPAGAPLRESCVYALRGEALPAAWWSVTLYAADHFLARNADDASAYGSHVAEPGAWRVIVSAAAEAAGDGPWISSNAAGDGFSLTLRLYRPDPAVRDAPSTLAPPVLETVSCAEGAA